MTEIQMSEKFKRDLNTTQVHAERVNTDVGRFRGPTRKRSPKAKRQTQKTAKRQGPCGEHRFSTSTEARPTIDVRGTRRQKAYHPSKASSFYRAIQPS